MRELLLRIEAGCNNVNTQHGSADAFHLRLLKDAHFIKSDIRECPVVYLDSRKRRMEPRLTWAGCEYLESIRDEGKWEKVKQLIASKGESAPVETVKAAAGGNGGRMVVHRR